MKAMIIQAKLLRERLKKLLYEVFKTRSPLGMIQVFDRSSVRVRHAYNTFLSAFTVLVCIQPYASLTERTKQANFNH